jgi:hypothetical protein
MISTLQMRGLVSHGELQFSSQTLCLSLTFLFSYKFHFPSNLNLSDFLHTKPEIFLIFCFVKVGPEIVEN